MRADAIWRRLEPIRLSLKNMNKVKKVALSILLPVFFLFSIFGRPGLGFAQQLPPNLDSLKNQVPAPVSGFINSIQSIGTDFRVGNAWLKVDGWFSNTTGGTSLTDVLKFSGNLLIWIFSVLVNLIKWGLSLL